MRVPESSVLRHDGETVSLHGLAAQRPIALVFLRHLGCVFCREQVATLRDAMPEENVAFVSMSEPKQAARFRIWMKSPHPFLCDPPQRLYREFGLQRASLGGLIGPRVAVRGFEAYRAGFRGGRVQGDGWQLGGTFVMEETGQVSAAFPAIDAGDHPSPDVAPSYARAPCAPQGGEGSLGPCESTITAL